MTSNRVIAARVARGAVYLDKVKSDWYRRVNADRANFASQWDCIGGQAVGNYYRLPEMQKLDQEFMAVPIRWWTMPARIRIALKSRMWGWRHGFDPLIWHRLDGRLRAAWANEITARRELAAAADRAKIMVEV
jgi:hypothetical protein